MPVIHLNKPSKEARYRAHLVLHRIVMEVLTGKRKCNF